MTNNLTTYTTTDGTWKEYADKDKLIEYVNPIDTYEISKQSAEVLVKKIPFYEDVELIRISPDKWAEPHEEVFFFFAKTGDTLIELRGLNQDLYELNEVQPPILNDDTYLDYLKFFCYFLAGDAESNFSRFYVLEGKESEFIQNLSGYEKDKYIKGYDGPKIDTTSNPYVLIDARVIHDSYNYDAQFELHSDGTVVMLEDEPV